MRPDTSPQRSRGRPGYLSIQGAGKTYNPGREATVALRNVSFEVGSGEFVSILGASGCGKSTLLMMVSGLEPITAGRVLIGGEAVSRPRPDVGIIFQDATLLPWQTALQNVLFPIEIMRRSIAEYRPKAEELLALVGLQDVMHKKPAQLSGGMRQRVAICRALVHNPSLLLLDEPFSALDAITRDELNVALLDIWERYQQTAVFVTHSIREAVYLSDRVIVLGGRPAGVVADVQVPFARPRPFSIGDTMEFNQICATLRGNIADGHRRQQQARAA
jgi:NitT/TauT family transport system ATP-binding protein